ncbi:MAG: 2OG-Fe(II) oxygenase [Pseudobacteriovorax sp.]|nr:2OG-Fe(II) oxygenase [Pseudobacteriovorax sp.]
MNLSIEKIIKDRFQAGNFCTSFENDPPYMDNLDLSVEGFGPLKLPLQPRFIKKLIEQSEPSKFGFKDKTLYDPGVRNSHEIKSEKIDLGDAFLDQVNSELPRIKKDLLLAKNSQLRAELHNMLIYEKGCFFDYHQDSEKEDGMVATLVIVLPTRYNGGGLTIEYLGQTEVMGRNSATKFGQLAYIAFYADCKHKLEQVTSGYRVALTFNLMVSNPEELKPSKNETELSKALKDYFTTNDSESAHYYKQPRWFVYLLNHQYTLKSLNWKMLKGVDKKTARDLKDVADRLDLEIFLSLAEVQETWDAIDNNSYYSRSRFRGRSNDEDYELGDLINSETTLSNWLDKNGDPVKFKSHFVSSSMIFYSVDNDEFDPEDTEYEGYMGNYGNTEDRWYKRSAIVMWERDVSLSSKFSIDPNLAIEELIRLFETDRKQGAKAYETIYNEFINKNFRLDSIDPDTFVELCIAIGKKDKLSELIDHCSLSYILNLGSKNITTLLVAFSDLQISSFLKPKSNDHYHGENLRDLFGNIILSIHESYPLSSKILINKWITHIKKKIIPEDGPLNSIRSQKDFKKQSKALLENIIPVLEEIDMTHILKSLFKDFIESRSQIGAVLTYEVLEDDIVKKHVFDLHLFKKLCEETKLEAQRILAKTDDTDNLCIDLVPKGKDELCESLKKFLLSPTDKEMIWKINKDKRQYIQSLVTSLELPVSHKTVRTGSPHQLVLNKTAELGSWRKKRARKYKKILAQIG